MSCRCEHEFEAGQYGVRGDVSFVEHARRLGNVQRHNTTFRIENDNEVDTALDVDRKFVLHENVAVAW